MAEVEMILTHCPHGTREEIIKNAQDSVVGADIVTPGFISSNRMPQLEHVTTEHTKI